MINAYERPGVYSDYTINNVLYSSDQNHIIGLVGVNTTAQTGTIYTIEKLSEAQTTFGASSTMTKMCQAAFANGAYKIKAVVCASQNPTTQNYEDSFDLLEDVENIQIMLCDSEDLNVLKKLKTSVTNASENRKERIAIVTATKANASSYAQELNCERMVMLCQTSQNESSVDMGRGVTAAAIAGKIANNGNPSNSFNSSVVYGMYKLETNYSETDVETLLGAGVSLLETVAGEIEIIRLVTTRTKTSGVADKTFHDLNTVLIIDDVIPSIRKRLTPLIGNVKNNSDSLNAIATQVTVELESKKKSELIDSYSQPNVYLSQSDRSVCIAEVEFTVARGINRIVVSAIINV